MSKYFGTIQPEQLTDDYIRAIVEFDSKNILIWKPRTPDWAGHEDFNKSFAGNAVKIFGMHGVNSFINHLNARIPLDRIIDVLSEPPMNLYELRVCYRGEIDRIRMSSESDILLHVSAITQQAIKSCDGSEFKFSVNRINAGCYHE